MRILFIQARQDAMKDHEYQAILTKSGLLPANLISFDIFERLITPDDLDGFDALMIGGSGKNYVSKHDIPAEIDAIENVLREARRRQMPTLGICFGAHLMTEAFGGLVVNDRQRQETGTYEISVSNFASHDPLLSQLPKTFLAQEGHIDQIEILPPGAVILAGSKLSQNQAYTFPDEPIYAIQFHPELSREDILTRARYYQEQYLCSLSQDEVSDAGAAANKKFEEIEKITRESPEAEKVLTIFLEQIVKQKKRHPELVRI